jgi:uncharacterized protein YutE (UPF0331/DUF86 family)
MSPGRVDAVTVRRYLIALDEILSRLTQHASRPIDVLVNDVDQRWAVERGLQLCTQSVLDIATHLVASSGRDAPDYATAIDELGRLGIVPSEFAARLRPLAGFRNALVHGYLGVDTGRLHAVLNLHLDEVREFARLVDGYLARSEP